MSISRKDYWWRDEPWRMVQTNLREIDMADLDAEQYVAEMKAFHATIAMINAGGIIASYPTKLEFQFQSPYLTGDSLERVIEVCHRENIRVIARCDFSKIRREVYEQHPEWAFRQANGEPILYNGDVHACVLGEYQRQKAFEILDEMLTNYDFDGVFLNMSGFISQDYSYRSYGLCHCKVCAEKYREFCGRPLPDTPDETYMEFKRVYEKKCRHEITQFIETRYPHVCLHRDVEQGGFWRAESNTGVNRPSEWPYTAAENVKRLRGSYPMTRISNTTVDYIDFSSRHCAISPGQQSYRIAQSLCSGGEADYYMIGRADNHQDKTGFAPVRRMFALHQAHEELFAPSRRLVADVLLVYPTQEAAEYRGWFRMLTEAHICFSVVMQEELPRHPLDGYRAVILPDAAKTTQEEAALLRAYVQNGGRLLVSGRCDLNFLGMTNAKEMRENIRGSYLLYDDEQACRLNSKLTFLDDLYCFRDYREETKLHGKLLPPQPFGAPERCYPVESPIENQPAWAEWHGQVTIPWCPGKLYDTYGYQTSAALMRDVLTQVCGIVPLQSDLPPMALVNEFVLQDGRTALYIANNMGCFHNTFFAAVPLPACRVTLPELREESKVRAQIAGIDLPICRDENGTLYFETPAIAEMEIITISP